jgi:TatD DNase family protein
VAALLDTHLHLYRDDFAHDREEARARARAAGVGAWVHIGYDHASNERAQGSAAEDGGWATAGLHPHDAASWGDAVEEQLRALARDGRIVAVGECGLDFFRNLSPRAAQDYAFRRQIALAKELDLPMVHHVRDAYPEARRVLEEEGLPPRRGVFHAFAGDADFARWAVDEGYKLGIGGPLTYPNSRLDEIVVQVPVEALQLETDAPWLPPQPWRGRRNEPAYARHTAERIAALRGTRVDHLAEVWAREFETLFRVELQPALWELEPGRLPLPEEKQRSK